MEETTETKPIPPAPSAKDKVATTRAGVIAALGQLYTEQRRINAQIAAHEADLDSLDKVSTVL